MAWLTGTSIGKWLNGFTDACAGMGGWSAVAKPLQDGRRSLAHACEDGHAAAGRDRQDLWSPWGPAKRGRCRRRTRIKSTDRSSPMTRRTRARVKSRVSTRTGARQATGSPANRVRRLSAGHSGRSEASMTPLRDQRFEALRAMLDIGTSDGARAVTVNGAPVSEGNPLPVTFGQQAQLQAEGSEAFGGGSSGGGTGGGEVPDTRNWWERHAPKWAGGKDAPTQNLDDNGAGHGGRSGGSNADMDRRAIQMMDRLVKTHGWTPEAAAIAAGNAQQESGVRSDGPMGDPSVPGGSWGMGQWNRERLTALKEFAGKQGKNWQDFDTQVDFWAKEAAEKIPAWSGQKDLRGAGMISHLYEGYGDNSTGTRVANAERFLRILQLKRRTVAARACCRIGCPAVKHPYPECLHRRPIERISVAH